MKEIKSHESQKVFAYYEPDEEFSAEFVEEMIEYLQGNPLAETVAAGANIPVNLQNGYVGEAMQKMADDLGYKGSPMELYHYTRNRILRDEDSYKYLVGRINKDTVYRAANWAVKKGEVVTVDKIYKRLQRGSINTILKYLKEWEADTGNAITTQKHTSYDEVRLQAFNYLDKWYVAGEKYGTKKLAAAINTSNFKRAKQLIEDWKASRVEVYNFNK